ncbi:glucan endo-1,3-beta-glucosidase 14-like isoform X2 [Oryza glaberrima]|nr:glucan endo-1,3-beta-glucosidase 14-like isoform X2 [Oryza glaberrima]XP_052155536.1 glucan endo-1,3-beta-glucosidase 14-like isoform X2 [Oryza glaberrima]XP_052155537.1 glucan endo-1,3-beta-glucosidase 14-like isoform X2 [Oryza glaberrima]XP_052155538.1 glucan endo-1,3-beta-glucosidase 14-like isoform X2 [Oryza glaberrima]
MRNCSPVSTSRELSLRRAAAKPEAGMELCAVFFSSAFSLLLLLLLLSAANDVVVSAATSPPLKFGINYGQIANNLPHPTQVSGLLQSLSVNRVKLYDADPAVLAAFAGTGVEFIVGNEDLHNLTDARKARAWVAQHVQPFLPATRITCVTVGNEVLSGKDTAAMQSLLPAMQSVHQALLDLGLAGRVNVSTAHSVNILATSYPPSAGAFREDLAQYIQPLLNFHAEVGSPFLVNAYPFFAYKASPASVSLPYVLFEPNPGVRDPATNLTYDNMLYAQIDAVYAAMKAMGHADITVRISETGWPSKGDDDEVGATPQNAAAYNGNLMKRIAAGEGTPLKPAVPVDVFVFALFNEDMKPGPSSERNYGLFYPNGTPVYNIGFDAASFSPSPTTSTFSSSSRPTSTFLMGVVVLLAAFLL